VSPVISTDVWAQRGVNFWWASQDASLVPQKLHDVPAYASGAKPHVLLWPGALFTWEAVTYRRTLLEDSGGNHRAGNRGGLAQFKLEPELSIVLQSFEKSRR